MTERGGNNLGDSITRIVDDVVSSGDFEKLNKSIRETIDAVFDELNIAGAGEWAMGGSGHGHGQGGGADKWAGGGNAARPQGAARPNYERKSWSTVIKEAMDARANQLYTSNPAGQISGPVLTALGAFLAAFNGLFGITGLIMSIGGEPVGFGVSFFLLAMAALGGLLMKKGLDSRKRIKRFRTYVLTFGARTYCQISELAAAVGKSKEFVVEDLRKMIEMGYFPHGRIDMQQTTLMLDDESYEQYLKANESFLQRQAEEQKAQKKQKKEQSIFATGNESAEVAKAMAEGEKYIRQIREANDAIPGEEITKKLDRLELLMKKIFTVLSQKPDQLPKLRKFMNYYMPTTDKLVQTYRELDAQPVEGENIQKAKRDIEDTLDTINDAYEKLLDNFFAEAAMDVSTDITVLQGLMAQEGLTAQPFGSTK